MTDEDVASVEAETGSDDSEVLIHLPPVCHLTETEQVLDRLAEMPADAPLVFDASQVEQMSAACAMVVVSAVRHRGDDAPKAAVIEPTSEFMDAFSDLGMFQDLMKMEFRQ